MFAAAGVGQLGLGFCRNGANDRRAEGGRPLTENEPGLLKLNDNVPFRTF